MMAGIVAGGWPLMAVEAQPTDPYWASVVSLLNFEGADGSVTTTDAKGGAWAFSGNAKISTAKSKFGGSSLLCDGNGDFIEATKAGFTVPMSGDYTIEFFVNFTTVANRQIFLGSASSTYGYFDFRRSGTPRISWAHDEVVDGTSDISAGVWYHVAASRSAGNLRLFVDGVQQGATRAGKTLGMNTAGVFQVGCIPNVGGASMGLNGNLDSMRVTIGVGRYTADFTPPSAAFPVA